MAAAGGSRAAGQRRCLLCPGMNKREVDKWEQMKKARCPQNRGEVDDNREKVVADLSSLTPEVEVIQAVP
ncbi:hypothetical protein DUI87_18402 [Hirundo rustica rustica]|uniref:Uncharacterized protein n=1 Tax=Hirundo rustica rustica TaxID=333673 RepID=A0A3M0JWT0_HIRRU|nr:hypothetical protein DUI87_18402 [Hirundo rustica rustica]